MILNSFAELDGNSQANNENNNTATAAQKTETHSMHIELNISNNNKITAHLHTIVTINRDMMEFVDAALQDTASWSVLKALHWPLFLLYRFLKITYLREREKQVIRATAGARKP